VAPGEDGRLRLPAAGAAAAEGRRLDVVENLLIDKTSTRRDSG
jgi:hypothetical protein